jgi:hypothetical protein
VTNQICFLDGAVLKWKFINISHKSTMSIYIFNLALRMARRLYISHRCWLLTVETWVHFQVDSCEIPGRPSGSGTGFWFSSGFLSKYQSTAAPFQSLIMPRGCTTALIKQHTITSSVKLGAPSLTQDLAECRVRKSRFLRNGYKRARNQDCTADNHRTVYLRVTCPFTQSFRLPLKSFIAQRHKGTEVCYMET